MPAIDAAKDQPRTVNRSVPWTALDRIASPITLAEGAILFRQGENAHGVFLLRKGRIRLYMHSPGHKELSYHIVGPGSVLGFPATFSNAPYSLTAKSLANCELGFVDAAEVIELMSKDADLCFHALQSMSQEVRKLRKKQASVLSSAVESGR